MKYRREERDVEAAAFRGLGGTGLNVPQNAEGPAKMAVPVLFFLQGATPHLSLCRVCVSCVCVCVCVCMLVVLPLSDTSMSNTSSREWLNEDSVRHSPLSEALPH